MNRAHARSSTACHLLYFFFRLQPTVCSNVGGSIVRFLRASQQKLYLRDIIIEIMTNILRRFPDKSIFGTIPAGVNPFAYILNLITPQYFLPLSKYTLGLLVFFFIVHLLIALFCIVILVLPYLRGRKQSQWFLRRLYIKDRSGTDGLSIWFDSFDVFNPILIGAFLPCDWSV
jgi:hypothetical protein